MAGVEERSPLLGDYENDAIDILNSGQPRQRFKKLFDNERGANSPADRGDSGLRLSPSSQTLTADDRVVAIFIVAFDTKAGNLIEWCMPEDAELDGVEFKAMASGSHTLQKDFVYFKHNGSFGLACFENMKVESEIERGARMKSVGILATSYTLLYRHMQFLDTQVRHQLEVPARYGQLNAFWEDKKGTLPATDTSSTSNPIPLDIPHILPEMKITHPAGCFSQFIKFFGVHIFVLWKYVLLGKRILFFSPPPIGVVCYRVYCACCLGNHGLYNALGAREAQPHFYVNVADIETLETEMKYIACTTEKIFETKTHLYDVYVDNQNVTTSSEHLRDILKISDADRDKFTKLNNQRNQEMFTMEEYGETEVDEEDIFANFFVDLNTRLFHTLLEVAGSADRQLTSDHMKSMGLDPVGDRSFLMELVETYGIDVMLMVDNPCCPR